MAMWSSRPAAKDFIMSFPSLMFGFKGRITRAQFWLAALILAAAWWGAFMFATLVTKDINLQRGHALLFALSGAINITTMVSFAAIGAKRLHDRDRTGWWMLLFFFAPYLLGPFLLLLLSDFPSDTELMIWAGATLLPFHAWGLIVLGVLPGMSGPNRFGEAPQAANAARPA
jgi:uncharacterized membrane protein YhaH (DUF805 family)